jgi:hypothetical protein
LPKLTLGFCFIGRTQVRGPAWRATFDFFGGGFFTAVFLTGRGFVGFGFAFTFGVAFGFGFDADVAVLGFVTATAFATFLVFAAGAFFSGATKRSRWPG